MRLLILHASAGAGHRRAAEALAAALPLADPGSEAVVRDILDFTPAFFRRSYGRGYLEIVRRAPELWGYLYAESDRRALRPVRARLRSLFNKVNTRAFASWFDECRVDAVACTHFLPLEVLSRLAARGRCALPLFCAVTDFAVHSLWVVGGVSCYYVATEEARRRMLRKGQPPSGIEVTGIPVDPVFAAPSDSPGARRELGLPGYAPVVLLLTGGCGVGPAADLVRAFGGSPSRVRLLVVAGNNARMRKEAEAAAVESGAAARVFGFADNIHVLMDAADAVISKPGGLTSAEVVARGKPLLIVDPIPGQEQRNAEYLLEAGAAVRLHDPEDAPFLVDELLSDPGRLAGMKAAALRVARPGAALRITGDILRRLSGKGRPK